MLFMRKALVLAKIEGAYGTTRSPRVRTRSW
jgi:hypothetical protein